MARYLDLVRQDAAALLADTAGFEDVACPGCGGGDAAKAFHKDGFTYLTCRECGTLFASPRPSQDALRRFYTDSPSSRYWVESFFKPVAEARRMKVFRPRATHAARMLDDAGNVPAIADLGAGFGVFLEELRRVRPGARVVAIEPAPDMAGICRSLGLEVVESQAEAVTSHDNQFDLVTAFELLEHVHNADAFVRAVARMLKPGGRCFFTTLSGGGFDIQVLWERSQSVSPPHHLNFFNPRSARLLLARADLAVESVTTPGRLDWDIVERMIQQGASADRFWSVVAQYASDDAKRALQSWIADHGFSSHMWIVGRRPPR
jgi:SAM-dependent methyltransferase